MNRRNYQRELERIIQKRGQSRPRVLLHCCCGPCSSAVLEYLTQYFDLTLLWYNPNIYPQEEFERRFQTLVKLVEDMGLADRVTILAEPRRERDYYERVKGLEDEPEGGKRCDVCFRLRLQEAARQAKEGSFDYFTTTLSISPLKDADKLNQIGEEVAAAYGVPHLPSNFKKKNGYKRSIELSKEYDLYRQNYCGCVFSRGNR